MALTDNMLKKIKEEIELDQDKLGYKDCKDDIELANLLSSSIFKERVVIDASPSPLNRILRGIADGPNIITADEVRQAKLSIL